jgi:hypothetical protein
MSSTLLWVLFLISVLLFAGLGLLLLILGIIQKKAGQWIPGILVMVCSMVFCIAGFAYLIGKTADYNKCSNINYYDNYTNPDEYENEEEPGDTANYGDDESISKGESYVTGFIRDADKSLIHIKVIPDPILKDMGISLVKIDTYSASGNKNKTIPLTIDFSKKFKGELQLLLYSSDNEEIGKSLVQVSQNENTAFTIKFLYDNETNFLKTEYARLKSSY